jgi:hypothetical protein
LNAGQSSIRWDPAEVDEASDVLRLEAENHAPRVWFTYRTIANETARTAARNGKDKFC